MTELKMKGKRKVRGGRKDRVEGTYAHRIKSVRGRVTSKWKRKLEDEKRQREKEKKTYIGKIGCVIDTLIGHLMQHKSNDSDNIMAAKVLIMEYLIGNETATQ